jgi:type I restriction enzyme S subunit
LWTKRLELLPGDIILAREAPVGEVEIIPQRKRVCLGQRTVLIRPKKKLVDPYYLLYLLLTKEIKNEVVYKLKDQRSTFKYVRDSQFQHSRSSFARKTS